MTRVDRIASNKLTLSQPVEFHELVFCTGQHKHCAMYQLNTTYCHQFTQCRFHHHCNTTQDVHKQQCNWAGGDIKSSLSVSQPLPEITLCLQAHIFLSPAEWKLYLVRVPSVSLPRGYCITDWKYILSVVCMLTKQYYETRASNKTEQGRGFGMNHILAFSWITHTISKYMIYYKYVMLPIYTYLCLCDHITIIKYLYIYIILHNI